MLGGKIIERQQYVAIFLEAGNGFVVFDSVKRDEAIERRLGILARLGDYKRDIYGNSENDKREFLADVSSFANTIGGDIVIGIDEASGLPRPDRPRRGASRIR
jgi:hypothetical protein